MSPTPFGPWPESNAHVPLPRSLVAGDPSLQPLVLSTSALSLQVVPALGGKILSLVDRTLGTEWMWSPPDGRGLFRNALGNSCADSILAGADEFFPTVAACEWKGRRLPDRGEFWAVPWQILDHSAGCLDLEVRAPDPLDVAAAWNRCQRLAPGASIPWHLGQFFEIL